ncbi:MAG: cobalamin-dependent protein [Polyangiaceae bacterium]|nr:cobalamin-dependent protein [Polyangiaceae bacterium]
MPEGLEEKLETVASVPPAAADAYYAHGATLACRIDAALQVRPDSSQLIGPNPLATAFDNHANHWRFMSNVFRLNNMQLLARVLPWVYRVYRARGFSLDYFPFVLKSFQEAVLAELGPELAAPIAAVYERVLELHETTAALAESEGKEAPAEAVWLTRSQAFCEALLAADGRRVYALSERWVKTTSDIVDFLQIVVTGAMIEIGRRWERNEISVAQEHLASSLVNRVMASLYPRIVRVVPHRGSALVSCAANEFHEIGSRILADLLELDGWDVQYLGTNTPITELIDWLKVRPVCFVALSVAMPFNLHQATEAISQIRKLEPSVPKILLGGRAFSLAPSLWRDVGGDAYCPTAEAGVAVARAWSDKDAA